MTRIAVPAIWPASREADEPCAGRRSKACVRPILGLLWRAANNHTAGVWRGNRDDRSPEHDGLFSALFTRADIARASPVTSCSLSLGTVRGSAAVTPRAQYLEWEHGRERQDNLGPEHVAASDCPESESPPACNPIRVFARHTCGASSLSSVSRCLARSPP